MDTKMESKNAAIAGIFRKRIDWFGLSVQLNFYLVVLWWIQWCNVSLGCSCLFWGGSVAFFSIVCLVLVGTFYYQLSVDKDSLIETRLFHKQRVVAASSVVRVVVSLNGHIRIETTEGEKIHLCCMQDMDSLWLKLLEWAGKDKIVFEAGTTL